MSSRCARKRNGLLPEMSDPHWVGMQAKSDVASWLRQGRERLNEFSDNPGLEAQVLLAHVLGQSRAWLLAHPEAGVPPEAGERLAALLGRLAAGEPLPYLTGRQEFYGLAFEVTPEVLIPRPETELLVDQALGWLAVHPQRRLAVDVGTGSGCIAVSLAVHAPDLAVLAVDRSIAALRVARRNALRHQVDGRLAWVQSDLLTAADAPLDLVCANLPYIPDATLAGLRVAQYEPRLALSGGERGLDLIAALLADAPRWLAPGGLLLMEIEAGQGESVLALGRQAFPGADVRLIPDLAGQDRVVRVERREA